MASCYRRFVSARERGVCAKCLVLLFLAAVGMGCSSKPVIVAEKMDPAQEHLMHVGNAYQMYQGQHKKPPASAQDLTPILKQFGDPARLLRSPRDDQPYVICFGVDMFAPPTWAKTTPVIAYEQKGKDGNRFVLTHVRSVERLTDQEFRQASFPPGHKPPL